MAAKLILSRCPQLGDQLKFGGRHRSIKEIRRTPDGEVELVGPLGIVLGKLTMRTEYVVELTEEMTKR